MKKVIICILMIAIFAGCQQAEQKPTKIKQIDEAKRRAAIVFFFANYKGQNWGKKEYQAENENQKLIGQ